MHEKCRDKSRRVYRSLGCSAKEGLFFHACMSAVTIRRRSMEERGAKWAAGNFLAGKGYTAAPPAGTSARTNGGLFSEDTSVGPDVSLVPSLRSYSERYILAKQVARKFRGGVDRYAKFGSLLLSVRVSRLSSRRKSRETKKGASTWVKSC